MRYPLVVFVAILLAAAGLGTVDSPAKAAGGDYASRYGGGKILLFAREKRLLTLHNNVPKNHGLKPFCVHPALQKAARAHSKDMIQHDYISHDTRGRNEDACTRIRRFGYRWSYCGENIGYSATPEGMFRSWMRSSIHRPNILDGRFHVNRFHVNRHRCLYGRLQRLQDYHVYCGPWCLPLNGGQNRPDY